MNKTLLLLLLTFQLSYAQGVNNSTTLNLTDGVTVTVRGNYTHEANAVVNLEAGTVLNIEGSMTDNGGSFNGDGEVYLNDVDVYGCTDPLADNYDENATIDDGSCIYPDNGDYSLSFDGEDDYVDIDNFGQDFQDEISITAWVNVLDNGWSLIQRRNQNAVDFIFDVNTDNRLYLHLGSLGDIDGNITISNNEWTYISMTYDGQTVKIYVDGVLDNQMSASGIIGMNSSTLMLGKYTYQSQYNWFYDGLMDDIAIWNSSLTQEQIQSNMNSELTGDEEGLVGYWKFNAGQDSILYDHSGNQNHGTINGATWVENIYGCTDSLATNYNPEATSNDDSCYHGVVTDVDGNEYQAVQIGEQLWMKENLQVTHYNDGTEIPTGYSNEEWTSLSTGAYAVYNDDPANADIYGNLYNWYAVDTGNLAPVGWHVPTDDEIKQLEMYLGMSQEDADNTHYRGTDEGSKLAGRADLWYEGDLENNPEFGTSGFNFLPGGTRDSNNGNYYDKGIYGYFWSSTGSSNAWHRSLYYDNSGIYRYSYDKKNGFSVRCVRDDIIYGCTDSLATNYNPYADFDDGSCTGYPDNGDYSLQFDGVDDYTDMGGPVINQPSALTVSSWFKVNSTSSENYIFSHGNGGEVKVFINSGSLVAWIKTTTGYLPQLTVSVTTGQWYHYAVSFENNSVIKLYLDGSEVQSHSIGNVTLYSSCCNLTFGMSNNGDGNPFSGLIDEVAVWDDALTDAEITALYNFHTPLDASSNSGNYESSSNLQGYWKFNSGESDILYDHSGNQNHGTINGATWEENIYGCTDSLADNYDENADFDDGSCVYPSPWSDSVIPTPSAGTFQGQALVNGEPASEGDWVAAFDEDGNVAGATEITINDGQAYIVALVIYGDDNLTPDVDEGMNDGEMFTLKLWDSSEDIIWEFAENFDCWYNNNGAPMDGCGGLDNVYEFSYYDELTFNSSWNLISFDIAIEDNAPEVVFAEFLESGNLIYVTGFGESGSNYYDPSAPPPFNTLTSIEAGLGYWVKLNDSDDITEQGMPLTLNTAIDLMQSWNLIGYWPSENMSPEEAFAELIATGNLHYATGFDEGFTYYDPSLEPFFNTLTALENGYGYWLKLNEAVEGFQYPEPSDAVAKQLALNTNPDIVKTNTAMFVNGTVSFQDIDVEEGTRVNIYTESGLLVGEMDIVQGSYLRTGAVYGDDMTTVAVDGALQDEALVFRYNDYESDPISISFSGNMELAKVDLIFRNIPETFTLHQNFPNPFNPITTLRYDLPSDAFVTLTVYNMLGKEIIQLVNTTQLPGFESVQWNATDSMGRPVSAGVYLYQIQTGEFVQTKKMVLLK